MGNREKVKNLMVDVFLLDAAEFRFDLKRSEVETWDSMGVVALAVGIQETFGHHLSPEEATAIAGVQDVIDILRKKGIAFED